LTGALTVRIVEDWTIARFVLLGPAEADTDRLAEELVAPQLNGVRARPSAREES
jgi:hypothetical protein